MFREGQPSLQQWPTSPEPSWTRDYALNTCRIQTEPQFQWFYLSSQMNMPRQTVLSRRIRCLEMWMYTVVKVTVAAIGPLVDHMEEDRKLPRLQTVNCNLTNAHVARVTAAQDRRETVSITAEALTGSLQPKFSQWWLISRRPWIIGCTAWPTTHFSTALMWPGHCRNREVDRCPSGDVDPIS